MHTKIPLTISVRCNTISVSMGLLANSNDRREVKNALENAGRPLDQEEISKKTGLDPEETQEVVGSLVDQGEITTTLGWKYKVPDRK